MFGGTWLARERLRPPPIQPVVTSSATPSGLVAVAPPSVPGAGPTLVASDPTATPSEMDASPTPPAPSPAVDAMVPLESVSPEPALATDVPAATVTPAPTAATNSPDVAATAVPTVGDGSPRAGVQTSEGSGELRIRVSEGDTLTGLAERYYGSAGPRVLASIRAANPWLADPDVLWTGRILVLPAPRVDGTSGAGTPDDAGDGR
jgi:phage tail protein X